MAHRQVADDLPRCAADADDHRGAQLDRWNRACAEHLTDDQAALQVLRRLARGRTAEDPRGGRTRSREAFS